MSQVGQISIIRLKIQTSFGRLVLLLSHLVFQIRFGIGLGQLPSHTFQPLRRLVPFFG